MPVSRRWIIDAQDLIERAQLLDGPVLTGDEGGIEVVPATEVELVKEEVDRLRGFILSSYVSLSAEAYDFFLKIPSYVMRGAIRYAHRRLAEQGRL